jgi:hypothetical protein
MPTKAQLKQVVTELEIVDEVAADLAVKLKIAEAHRDTSRSLEISSKTLSDLTMKQELLITKLAEHIP